MAGATIGFAILGTGMIADHYHQAILDNADLGARLVAVGHYKPDRFAAISARFGVPCVSYEEILANPEVDVVCIGTPSGQHAPQAIAAAERGKHVLVEKPMALNLADADAMIAAGERAGVRLGVALQMRTKPLFQRIKQAIRNGDLGELTLGLVTMPFHRPMAYYDQAAWRGTWALDGGGVLMNQGIHQVDLLVWYMGDPVAALAYADTLHHAIEVEDTLAATLRFANGALATIIAATTAGGGFPYRLEIYGTNGGIQIEGDAAGRWQLLDPGRATVEAPELGPAVGAGGGSDPRGIGMASHVALVADFIQAIRQGRPPLIDGREGRRSLAAVLAVYQAAGLR